MTTKFEPGDRVIYVPYHAEGDKNHPDCERGTVSSARDGIVFVRFYDSRGNLAMASQACYPDTVFKENDV